MCRELVCSGVHAVKPITYGPFHIYFTYIQMDKNGHSIAHGQANDTETTHSAD